MENDPIIAIHCQSLGWGAAQTLSDCDNYFPFSDGFISFIWFGHVCIKDIIGVFFWELKSKYFSKISHEKALKAQGLDISLPFSTTIACYTKDFSESTKRFRSQTYFYSRSDFHKARLDVLYCLSV